MNGNHQLLFENAIRDFTHGMRKREVEKFRTTTFDRLKTNIADLQARQHSQRRLQDLTRLQSFLDAIEQYGTVVSTFCRNDEIVAFVWGPLQFLLQATSMSETAFGEILIAYEQMGKTFPLLLPYQDQIRVNSHLFQVVLNLYEDLLKFQRIVLRYFQQAQWQKIFSESWITCKSRFPTIFRDIAKLGNLIESQATPAQIHETRENIQQSRHAEDGEFEEQNARRFGEIRNWLRPADIEVDQATFVEGRAEYPGTGRWLLKNTLFKEWFHPQYATIPPLLWLNGSPGAGKTMLASLVVQEALALKPAPTVLYFYCKHEKPQRDNFAALGRSLLAQVLQHSVDLLPAFYQKFCRSGETILSSPVLIEELLTLALGSCKSAYIILDGLDECSREQRKHITKWFRKLIEDLPNSEADRLRCLFISQVDGAARKDFDGLASIRIRAEDTQHDIMGYCRVQAGKLLEDNPNLPYEVAGRIATTVAKSVKGHFLLARLIWTNLLNHTSIERIEEELQPNVFPKGINDAYHRIMVRINEQPLPAAREDASRLLSWLVCAKRPLKWHEIQVMNSINREERCVALERQSFIKSPQDLLSSLVETRADGSLDFCHLSVKFFLLETGGLIPWKEELKLSLLCIDYLNLPTFVHPPTKANVLRGDYGFMDYAVSSWLRHLEVGVTLETSKADERIADERIKLMDDLGESLQIFIEHYWNESTARFTLAKRYSDKIQHFKARPFYDQLEQAVASTKQQLKNFGHTRPETYALNLARIVCDVRNVIEQTVRADSGGEYQQTIEERYGTNIFKCPRFSCYFFTVGFSSSAERDKHIEKHERPFRCADETCVGYAFGFASRAEHEKHVREYHFDAAREDDEFPTQEDVDRSIRNQQKAAESSKAPRSSQGGDSMTDVVSVSSEALSSESDSEVEPQYRPRVKRARQTEFKCQHCNAVYKKRYNLQSHLLSHGSERSHVCDVCQVGFARQTDLKRHKNTHTRAKSFVCGGSLGNGESWGCGKSFARADTLNKHHESRTGRACIQPWRQEQENKLNNNEM